MNLEDFSVFRQRASSDGVLFYYTGEFSANVIGAMSDTVRERLEALGTPGRLGRKVFSTFMEMAQNILHYADETACEGGRIGALAVGQEHGKFYVLCGNPVRTDHVERLRARLDPLRRMTLDEIKAAYRDQLRSDTNAGDPISKGAGLGFLTVAREASEPIDYHIVFRADESTHAEFYLRAVI
ncbi:hypothetical protein E6C76_00465 [Pseudothauera nasutitermitis]|uniref:Uncharacterized protein n=1 Tax=Pseudothauera nasutitermitis TaxID=2565930 RepID=A0A4V3WCF3_9RHOO|nr:SiaB family protein kinase [Pseudothauera nasutitermitis]THF66904.1 hypothetical protein E6C76_00465 [Pseudothauera nasutitermitis]